MFVRDGRATRTHARRLPAALLATVLLIAFCSSIASALAWETVTVDAAGQTGLFTSLALDAAGHPHISYYDDTYDDLRYAWRDGAGWHAETVDSAGAVGMWTSLALDGAGNPRISYFDDTNDALKYAWKDGAGWHTETADSAGWVGEFSSLALDGAGNPRISYLERTWNDLKYAWRDGSGWHTERVDAYGILGWYTSLALDGAGNPRISYLVEWTDDLRYAWRDGAGWHFETVDTEGYVGKCSSLVLDGAGNPRISYFDDTFENKDDLKYAWRDSSGWHNETVDTDGLVGWDTSLALDAAGDPRISYYDDTNDDLRYAWKDGAGWHLETVDAAGKVGQFTSLALDGAGNPRISYHDRANGDLKFARTASPPPQEENVVPGAVGPPADTNGDGLYDDLNGNGRMDFSDVLVLFEQREWIAAHGPVERFDYNRNGLVDFADVVCFFNALGAPASPPITAAFSMDRANGTAPLEVRFTSTSTGPFDALAWTVTSGQAPLAAMNGTDPTFTFQAPGAYAVTLTARNTTTNRSAAVTQPVTVTAPTGPNLPFPGPHVLPGRVEAEDYDVSVSSPAYADTTTINEGGAYRFDAVDIEVINRNYNIGWIRRGEYLNYSVDSAGGEFALTLNVANAVKKTEPVRIYLDGASAGEVWIGLTADWVTFREFAASAPVTIPKGRHVVTVSFESVERMNLDWLGLAPIDPAPNMPAVPYPGPHVLPATVEAEHFDTGGEGAAYHDAEPANLGGSTIRTGEGVDIETAGGVTDVCFVRAGEYLNYSVDMAAAGNLTLSLRAANPDPAPKPIAVSLDGVPAGEVVIAPTGGWTAYREFAAPAPLAIPAGRHVVTVAFQGVERVNLDRLGFAAAAPTPTVTPNETATPTPTETVTPNETAIPTPTVTVTANETANLTPTPTVTPDETATPTVTVTPTETQTPVPVPAAPYPGAHVLPARVEAEHFDAGGEGVAYHDGEPANLGSDQTLRPGEGVDLETAGGVTDVCFVRAGEYLNYSVDMAAAGNLSLSLRAANPDPAPKPIAVFLDGVPAGEVVIAPTGGWVTDREFAAPAPLAIPEGRHVVTLGFQGVERVNLDWLDLAAEVPVPAVTPTPTVTAIPSQEYTLAVASLDLVAERVSIRNTGMAGVDLQGCTLSNPGPTCVYTFPAVVLEPGATLTVHTWSGVDTGTDLHWGLGAEAWHDLGDTATLRAPDGSLVSALARQALP